MPFVSLTSQMHIVLEVSLLIFGFVGRIPNDAFITTGLKKNHILNLWMYDMQTSSFLNPAWKFSLTSELLTLHMRTSQLEKEDLHKILTVLLIGQNIHIHSNVLLFILNKSFFKGKPEVNMYTCADCLGASGKNYGTSELIILHLHNVKRHARFC